MDQSLINIIFGAILAVAGWFLNTIYTSLKDLQSADRSLTDKVASIEVLVAGEYAKRDYVESHFERLSNAIFARLDKISDKIDGKADK